ncbi:MAG: cobalamin B12-binding domain-containing protein [Chloroflexi bacterium]|nr:cobalamin B12-binding domain-containing protein [Chloroflexota bacterium]
MNKLHEAVFNFDEAEAIKWVRIGLAEKVDPFEMAMDGLCSGIMDAGEACNWEEYFMPELLLCADALYAGLDILKPIMERSGRKAAVKGALVLGVVESSTHGIGKIALHNACKKLLKVMFEIAGWQVYDLGEDDSLDRFIEEQLNTGVEIIAISSLMTTSMLAGPQTIKKLWERNPKCRVMVSGTPLTRAEAQRYGADSWTENAGTVFDKTIRLLKMLRDEELK